MIEFIKKILEEYNYQQQIDFDINDDTNLLFKSKINNEFYILSEYTESDLKDYSTTNKTVSFLKAFEEFYEKNPHAKKNTALLMCVRVDSLYGALCNLKNYIYQVEEDVFFVKKYVILYSNNSLEELQSNFLVDRNVGTNLLEIIYDQNGFDSYWQKNIELMREDEFDQSYFLAMQLFVKLPFLILNKENKQYTDLGTLINEEVEKKNLTTFHNNLSIFINEIETKFNEVTGYTIIDMNNLKIDDAIDEILTKLGRESQ